jgi:hypothetical protein
MTRQLMEVDEGKIQDHLGEMVWGTVEERRTICCFDEYGMESRAETMEKLQSRSPEL